MNSSHDINIEIGASCRYKNYFFIMAKYFNAIFIAKDEEESLSFWNVLPEEDILGSRLCECIKIVNNKIIFVPLNARKIWIYNFKSNEWLGIELKEQEKKYKFYQAFIYNNEVIMFGGTYNAILRLNAENYEIKYDYEIISQISAYNNGDSWLRGNFYLENNNLILPICWSNIICKYCLLNGSFEIYKIGNVENYYLGVVKHNDIIWVAPRYNDAIVKIEKGEITYIELPTTFPKVFNFINIYEIDNRIYIPAYKGNQSIIIKETGVELDNDSYSFFEKDNDEVRFVNDPSKLIIINKEGKHKISLNYNRKELGIKLNEIRITRGVFYEEFNNVPFEMWVEMI